MHKTPATLACPAIKVAHQQNHPFKEELMWLAGMDLFTRLPPEITGPKM